MIRQDPFPHRKLAISDEYSWYNEENNENVDGDQKVLNNFLDKDIAKTAYDLTSDLKESGKNEINDYMDVNEIINDNESCVNKHLKIKGTHFYEVMQ